MTPSLFERPFVGIPKRGSVWIVSRIVGAATFLSIIWLVNTEAHRPLPVRELVAMADRAINGQANAMSSMLTGGPAGPGGPAGSGAGAGGTVSSLAAGVAATVRPYLMPARAVGRSTPVEGAVYAVTSFNATRASGALPFRTSMRLAGRIVTHTEKRLVAVYVLGFARSDQLLGPYLNRSFIHCETLHVPPVQPILPLLPLKGQAPICDGITTAGMIALNSATIPELAEYIADEVGTTVVDRTGILGRFNATLKWRNDRNGPSIFTALQEQFGLKLEVSTETLDVIVVDRVEGLTPRLR